MVSQPPLPRDRYRTVWNWGFYPDSQSSHHGIYQPGKHITRSENGRRRKVSFNLYNHLNPILICCFLKSHHWYLNLFHLQTYVMRPQRPSLGSSVWLTLTVNPGVVRSNPKSANVHSDVWHKSLCQASFVFHQWAYSLSGKAASCLESMLCGLLVWESSETYAYVLLAAVIRLKHCWNGIKPKSINQSSMCPQQTSFEICVAEKNN